MGEFVNLEVSETGVGTIRLDRPKVNALNEQVIRELGEIVERLRLATDVRSVVIWGGERVFAAGADINQMSDLEAVGVFRYIGGFQEVLTRLERLPQITIAAINGYALGGGCELSMACDYRICAEDSKLGQPEILLGVIPGAGGTQRMTRLVGVGRAKDIIYTGRFIDAEEARDIGLVHAVVPAGEVYDAAVKKAERFAKGPTVALMAAKQAIQFGYDVDMDTAMTIERQAFASLFATEDQKIGMKSFQEEGPGKAKFVGR